MNMRDDEQIELIDLLSTKIDHAWSISNLLTVDGASKKGFSSNHEIVSNSINAITEILDEARQELKRGSG